MLATLTFASAASHGCRGNTGECCNNAVFHNKLGRALKSIGNADAGLSAVEISSVSRDQQCVIETRGGPDDGIGKFEFVFLPERDRFTSDSFVKFNYRKLPEEILPDSS